MGIPRKVDIAPEDLGWQCAQCMTPLSKEKHHILGDFRGKYGGADFLNRVVNVNRQPAKVQHMLSGEYVTQDLSCRFCNEYLGWTYVRSFDLGQQYKVGKFCLEAEQTLHTLPEAPLRTSRSSRSLRLSRRSRLSQVALSPAAEKTH